MFVNMLQTYQSGVARSTCDRGIGLSQHRKTFVLAKSRSTCTRRLATSHVEMLSSAVKGTLFFFLGGAHNVTPRLPSKKYTSMPLSAVTTEPGAIKSTTPLSRVTSSSSNLPPNPSDEILEHDIWVWCSHLFHQTGSEVS